VAELTSPDVESATPFRPLESLEYGRFQPRLKFGKQTYCVAEVRIGEEAAETAKKLQELAAQIEARSN